MADEGTQAETQAAPVVAAPSSVTTEAAPKLNRHDEYFGSLTDPSDVMEAVKRSRKLLEPDFQKQDKTYQQRLSAAERRAKDAEDAADPDNLALAQQWKGSLEDVKKWATKNGVPAWAVRNARAVVDVLDAVEEFQKNKPAQAQSAPAEVPGEDVSAHIKALQAAGYAVTQPGAPQRGLTQPSIRGSAPMAISDDDIDKAYLEGRLTGAEYRARLKK